MNSSILMVKAYIVFKKDGLVEDTVRNELCEDVNIIDDTDDILSYVDDNGVEHEEPIKMFLFDCPLSKFFKVKLKWNCFTAPNTGDYVLFPR